MGLEPRPPALSLTAPTQGGSAGTHPLPPAQEGAPTAVSAHEEEGTEASC